MIPHFVTKIHFYTLCFYCYVRFYPHSCYNIYPVLLTMSMWCCINRQFEVQVGQTCFPHIPKTLNELKKLHRCISKFPSSQLET